MDCSEKGEPANSGLVGHLDIHKLWAREKESSGDSSRFDQKQTNNRTEKRTVFDPGCIKDLHN